jgi:ferric-chelate reductase
MSTRISPGFPAATLLDARASTAADRLVRDQTQTKFTKQIWYLIASVVALLMFIRIARYLHSFVAIPKPTLEKESEKSKSDLEGASSSVIGRISLRRLPLAIATAFRIVAFRWTIVIGTFAVSSVSELAFILGYMVAIFIWLLVDSKSMSALCCANVDLIHLQHATFRLCSGKIAPHTSHLPSCLSSSASQARTISFLVRSGFILRLMKLTHFTVLTGVSHEKARWHCSLNNHFGSRVVLVECPSPRSCKNLSCSPLDAHNHEDCGRVCIFGYLYHLYSPRCDSLPEQFDFTHPWMQAGAIGLAAFSLATLFSIRPIRHLAFEFFLLSHIVLIAYVIATLQCK